MCRFLEQRNLERRLRSEIPMWCLDIEDMKEWYEFYVNGRVTMSTMRSRQTFELDRVAADFMREHFHPIVFEGPGNVVTYEGYYLDEEFMKGAGTMPIIRSMGSNYAD